MLAPSGQEDSGGFDSLPGLLPSPRAWLGRVTPPVPAENGLSQPVLGGRGGDRTSRGVLPKRLLPPPPKRLLPPPEEC